MRLVRAVAFIAFFSPLGPVIAEAAPAGPPVDHFAQTWTSAPTGQFTAPDHELRSSVVPVHAAAIPDGVLADALASSADATFRRDLAIGEMASAWEPAQRAALEDLRDAQRRYVSEAGGDRDARGARFAVLLHQVIDGTGRSVSQDGTHADERLGSVYDRVIRDASDAKLSKIEAAEKAWTAYRDAFDRFAMTMDRSDGAKGVRQELARQRIDELESDTVK